MVQPRIDEKRLPVAGRPGMSSWCVPDIAPSITAQCPPTNQLLSSYLKSGIAAKAPFTKPRSSSLPKRPGSRPFTGQLFQIRYRRDVFLHRLRLCWQGPSADLLHEGQEITHTPMICDLSITHAHDID